MKYIKQIFALLVVAITIFSCSRTSETIFDGSRSIVYFDRSSITLNVILDAEEPNIDTLSVVTSTPSSQDRTVFVSLVDSLTTISEDAFEFTSEVVIPAGELSGNFIIEGFPSDDLTTSNELIVFDIVEASDGSDINGSLTSVEVQIRLTCPLESTDFVGNYLIEQINPPVSDGDVGLFGPTVVEVFRPEDESDTSRRFEAVYLEGLGIGQPASVINFDIVCGEVQVQDGIETGLVCVQGEPAIEMGAPNNPSEIDTSDDSEFEITIRDLVVSGGCDGNPVDVVFLMTKQ